MVKKPSIPCAQTINDEDTMTKMSFAVLLCAGVMMTGCTFIDGHKNRADYAYTNAYEQELRNASAEIATSEVLFFNAGNIADLKAVVKAVKPKNTKKAVTVIENEYEQVVSNYQQLKYITDHFHTIKNGAFYVEILDLNQSSARNAALKSMIEQNLRQTGYTVADAPENATYKITVKPLQDGIGSKRSFYVVYWKDVKKGLVHFKVELTDLTTHQTILNYQVRGKMEAGKAYKFWQIFGPFTTDNTPYGIE